VLDVHPEKMVQIQAGQVRGRTDAAGPVVELRGMPLQVGDELAEVLDREIFPGRDEHWGRGRQDDRLEILERIIGELGV
jgi:hypothetical protein